jgi:hypothetical protein
VRKGNSTLQGGNMKTYIIIALFFIAGAVIAGYKNGYITKENVKRDLTLYFASCGIGFNIYIIYQLLTGI